MKRRILCILLALCLVRGVAWSEENNGIAKAIDVAVSQVEEALTWTEGYEQTSWMDAESGTYTLESYARTEDAKARITELEGTEAFRVLQYVLIPSEEADAATLTAYHAALTSAAKVDYVVNMNTKKFHRTDCFSVTQIKNSNRDDFIGARDELVRQGYEPCKRCEP